MQGFLIGERVMHFLSRFSDDRGEVSKHTDRGFGFSFVGSSGQVRTENTHVCDRYKEITCLAHTNNLGWMKKYRNL